MSGCFCANCHPISSYPRIGRKSFVSEKIPLEKKSYGELEKRKETIIFMIIMKNPVFHQCMTVHEISVSVVAMKLQELDRIYIYVKI